MRQPVHKNTLLPLPYHLNFSSKFRSRRPTFNADDDKPEISRCKIPCAMPACLFVDLLPQLPWSLAHCKRLSSTLRLASPHGIATTLLRPSNAGNRASCTTVTTACSCAIRCGEKPGTETVFPCTSAATMPTELSACNPSPTLKSRSMSYN